MAGAPASSPQMLISIHSSTRSMHSSLSGFSCHQSVHFSGFCPVTLPKMLTAPDSVRALTFLGNLSWPPPWGRWSCSVLKCTVTELGLRHYISPTVLLMSETVFFTVASCTIPGKYTRSNKCLLKKWVSLSYSLVVQSCLCSVTRQALCRDLKNALG